MAAEYLFMSGSPSELRRAGRALAAGALAELWSWIWPGVAAWIALAIVLSIWGPRDDSDGTLSGRSGMTPRIDALTGCQYLESSAGLLTPRLTAAGHPMCSGGSR